jgi:hypothetical protein
MTTTQPDLRALCDHLDALRAAASPGPWREWSEGGTDHDGEGWSQYGVQAPSGEPDGPIVMTGDDEQAHADAALIVAAVNALPTLTAALRDRDAALDRVRALADDIESTVMAGPGVIAHRIRAALNGPGA